MYSQEKRVIILKEIVNFALHQLIFASLVVYLRVQFVLYKSMFFFMTKSVYITQRLAFCFKNLSMYSKIHCRYGN